MSKSQKEVLYPATPDQDVVVEARFMWQAVADVAGRRTQNKPVAAVNAICPISQRTELDCCPPCNLLNLAHYNRFINFRRADH